MLKFCSSVLYNCCSSSLSFVLQHCGFAHFSTIFRLDGDPREGRSFLRDVTILQHCKVNHAPSFATESELDRLVKEEAGDRDVADS